MMDGSHVFGPVPSRRLGRSLGVDLVPYKTCSYDCVYCQLGRTTKKTVERLEYVRLEDVVADVEAAVQSHRPPNYITLAGSGEPTLFTPLDELIRRIKGFTDIPIAILTNGSLLWVPQVRSEIMAADVVVPSLDAGDEEEYQRVNRPHPMISFETMVNGLIEFAREYRGRLWLEVFLLSGLTARPEHVRKIADYAARIKPPNACI